ncbi:hypothetical protein SS50377_28163 [Spironucleus salmonicida]|uniref:Uncharacterized protein n=1 Tax=Spironucleus salmonicida TaxID=348837 RepID=V6LSR7_9EUKA|nr:hypothetical protein SS50377_28163 [Spironucleus salmonicida]|eukprot:EST47677.1 Hypothetical protein SS50377_12263 [Spironucleus salmonicida]
MNRNLFCTLYQPKQLIDNTQEVRRQKELNLINQFQINRQMQYYKQQSIADQPQIPENYIVNQRNAQISGKKLEIALLNTPQPIYINNTPKTHCQNDSLAINYKLSKPTPSTPKNVKKLANDAFAVLEKTKVKQRIFEGKTASKIDYKIHFVPEYERRANERKKYEIDVQLFDILMYQRQNGTFVETEKHDRIPLMRQFEEVEQAVPEGLRKYKDTMSQEQFQQLKLQNNLAEEALKILGAQK